MKTLKSIESTIRLGKGGVGVGNNNSVEHDGRYKFCGNKISSGKVDDSGIRDHKVVGEKNY